MKLEQLKEEKIWVNTKSSKNPKAPAWRKPVVKCGVTYIQAKVKAETTGKNVGIIFAASKNLVCIDVDVKDEMTSEQKKLVKKYQGLTMIETSISGRGRHIYLQCDEPEKLKILGSKIEGIGDFYCRSGFVLMTEDFVCDCREILNISAEDLLEDLQAPETAEVINVDFAPPSPEESKIKLKELTKILKKLTPWPSEAIEKEYCRFEKVSTYDNRDFWIKIICSVKEYCHYFGIEKSDGLTLLDTWSKADETGSYDDFDDVMGVWDSFEIGSKKGLTYKTVLAYSEKTVDIIAKFNEEWSFVNIPKKGAFCRLVDGEYELFDKSALLQRHASEYTTYKNSKKETKKILAAKYWMSHRDMQQYENIRFMPNYEGNHGGYLNTWQGFKVSEGSCDCEAHLDFIRKIICSEDEGLIKFIFSWIAELIQNPGCSHKQGVAIVLLGTQGTGKTFFSRMIGSLLGNTFMPCPDVDSLAKSFNVQFENKLLIGVDEGIFSNHKKTQDTLKNLITTEQMVYERKGFTPYSAPNYTRYIFTSNADDVNHAAIHVTVDDRRFQIIEVSDKEKNNKTYFRGLDDRWKKGADAAFLKYFQEYKLDENIDLQSLRVVTAATKEQNLESLPLIAKWILNFAEEGLNNDWEGKWVDECNPPINDDDDDYSWLRNSEVLEDYKHFYSTKDHMEMRSFAKYMCKVLGEHWETCRKKTKSRKNITFWKIPNKELFVEIVNKYYGL